MGDGFSLVFLHALEIDHRAMKARSEPVLQRPGYQRIYVDRPAHGLCHVGDRAATWLKASFTGSQL